MTIRKLQVTGRGEITASDIAFSVVEDGAVTVELENGDRLRIKPIVVNVFVGEHTDAGEREYFVQIINQVLQRDSAKKESP